MSPRRDLESPNPSLTSECAPPPGTKGEGVHSPSGEGMGESQFRRLEKSLALCLLCGGHCPPCTLIYMAYSVRSVLTIVPFVYTT
jgi:hypothetical protein